MDSANRIILELPLKRCSLVFCLHWFAVCFDKPLCLHRCSILFTQATTSVNSSISDAFLGTKENTARSSADRIWWFNSILEDHFTHSERFINRATVRCVGGSR